MSLNITFPEFLTLPTGSFLVHDGLTNTTWLVTVTAVLLVGACWSAASSYLRFAHLKHLPLVNAAKSVSLFGFVSKKEFAFHSKEVLARGRELFAGKPYRVLTDLGDIVFLPVELAREIRNDPRLSFGTAFGRDFHGHLYGFGGASIKYYKQGLLQTLVKKQLTRSLGMCLIRIFLTTGPIGP
jgi:hypothetical protein